MIEGAAPAMTKQFQDQGGAATMDPNPLMRWLNSRLITRLFSATRLEKLRVAAEKKRIEQSAPHLLEYFHQVEDGYSHLAAQVLQRLVARYDIELDCHLVEGPQGKNVPEPELLLQLSRYDAFHVAPEYDLEFPAHLQAPSTELVQQASSILAAQAGSDFFECVAEVGRALWADDAVALKALAADRGAASEERTLEALALGTERRTALKHYSGAMFFYRGEWYWGVDRLYHLEKRLASLGADRQPGEPMIMPRPDIDAGPLRDAGTLTLEAYVSLRSPYSAVALDPAVKLARDTGVRLVLRPVLPMVMRGVPATREKGMYIFMDAAREARASGVSYGNFYDPIGEPARRCYSLYPWAEAQGRGIELLSSFFRHAFVEGINTNNDRGMRKVAEAAGLDWTEALQHLGKSDWESIVEENRLAMYEAGLWGVPSFRLLDEQGEQVLALWGQDRLWLFAREIQRQLQKR